MPDPSKPGDVTSRREVLTAAVAAGAAGALANAGAASAQAPGQTPPAPGRSAAPS